MACVNSFVFTIFDSVLYFYIWKDDLMSHEFELASTETNNLCKIGLNIPSNRLEKCFKFNWNRMAGN